MPSGMPLPAAFAHMPFATNMNPEYMRYQQGLSYVVPTTVAPVGHFPYLPGLQTPFQPPVQTKQRIDGKSRDAARSGSPIKQHSVHPMYSSAGLMHPGHQGLQSYGYGGPLHQNTNKKWGFLTEEPLTVLHLHPRRHLTQPQNYLFKVHQNSSVSLSSR
jgi:hypothetical protein